MLKRRIGGNIMNDRSLSKDTQHGVIAGVCAGLARFLGLEIWLVRILTISALLLGGGVIVVLGYVALMFMLESESVAQWDARIAHTIKSRPWEQGSSPAQLLSVLQREFDEMEQRVNALEKQVMSDNQRSQDDT